MASKEMEQLKVGMKMMMERGFAPKFDGGMDPIHLRQIVQAAQERMATEPGVTFVPETLAGMEAELSLPKNARTDAIIIYIHGGGLICGNAFSSRGYASMLAGESKIPVYSFTYRLAPENPYPAAVDDCFAVYKAIVEKYPDKPLFLIGESGGAYLSIVTAMKARDNGVKMPAGVIPYSPPIEFENEIDRSHPNNKDFTVTPGGLLQLGKMYTTKEQAREIYAAPYYDDFHDLPPMLLAWDETESLAVDSEIIVEKLKAQGIEYRAKSYPDCFHAFATTGRGTPESYEILRDTVEFINRHIGLSFQSK